MQREESTQKQSDAQKEDALGNGNCAFNAFVLGMANQQVLDHIGELVTSGKIEISVFIVHAAEALNLKESAGWSDIAKKILEYRENNKLTDLQKELAPVMRQLAVTLMKSDENKIFIANRMVFPLVAAYNSFIEKKDNDPWLKEVPDDVFIPHKFIKEKFNELKEKQKIEKNIDVSNYLSAWWLPLDPIDQSGYISFVNEMEKDKKWAGDIELSLLAKYFHVGFDRYDKDRNLIHAVEWAGFFDNETEKLTNEQIKELTELKIIAAHDLEDQSVSLTKYEFLRLSDESFNEMLKKVNKDNVDVYKKLRQNHYEGDVPVITLTNPYGAHWSNVKVAKKEELKKEDPKKEEPKNPEPKKEEVTLETQYKCKPITQEQFQKVQTALKNDGWIVLNQLPNTSEPVICSKKINTKDVSFSIEQERISTQDDADEVFKAMLKVFKALYPEQSLVIKAQTKELGEKMKLAYKEVFEADYTGEVKLLSEEEKSLTYKR